MCTTTATPSTATKPCGPTLKTGQKQPDGIFGWLSIPPPPISPSGRQSPPPSLAPVSPVDADHNTDGDDEDDDQDHYYSLQHPSHIPTPKTLHHYCLEDGNEKEGDDSDNCRNKKSLTDQVLSGVGGAIFGSVSKLTSLLGDNISHSQHHNYHPQTKNESRTTNTLSSSPSWTGCGNCSNDGDNDDNDRDRGNRENSPGAKYSYWGSKRHLLMKEMSVTSISNTSLDSDTDTVDSNQVVDPRQLLGREQRDGMHSLQIPAMPAPPNVSSMACTSTGSSGETSLQRKWAIENAFNLHSSRASQRLLDDDEILLSLSLLTEDDDDDDDDVSDLGGNDENLVIGKENDIHQHTRSLSSSSFWKIHDAMEEASNSAHIQSRKHKGRFTGSSARQ